MTILSPLAFVSVFLRLMSWCSAFETCSSCLWISHSHCGDRCTVLREIHVLFHWHSFCCHVILSFPVCAHIQAFLSSFIYVDIFILTISFHPWGLRFPITAWKTNPCGGVSQSKPLAHIRTHSPRCPVLLYSICGEQLHCTSAVQPSNTASYNIGLFTALSLLGSVCLSIMQFPVSIHRQFPQ